MNTQIANSHGHQFEVRNQEEFERIVADIWDSQEYQFQADSQTPCIIDCGAHIGVSVAYFHSLYPQAIIVAFEPNPMSFELLQKNLAQNTISATTVNKAIAGQAGQLQFYISKDQEHPWSWGDSLVKNAWYSPDTTDSISVEAVQLSAYITQSVDLLKLDVEGKETEVIREIEPKLSLVKEIYIEFHGSSTNPDNQLDTILEILHKSSFTTTLKEFGQQVERVDAAKEDPNWVVIHGRKS